MPYTNNQPVGYIDELGKVAQGYTIQSSKPDSNGLISIVAPDSKVLRVNPKRIVTQEQGDSMEVQEKPAKTPKAPKEAKVAKTPVVKPVPEKVSLKEMAKQYEVWVKSDIDFVQTKDGKTDSKSVDVKSVCVIVEKHGKYLFFNTYDGTYGKKNTKPPLDKIENGEQAGFAIVDIEKLRGKLTKKGYKKEKA